MNVFSFSDLLFRVHVAPLDGWDRTDGGHKGERAKDFARISMTH